MFSRFGIRMGNAVCNSSFVPSSHLPRIINFTMVGQVRVRTCPTMVEKEQGKC